MSLLVLPMSVSYMPGRLVSYSGDAAGESGDAFAREVRDALGRLYDLPYLETHPRVVS